LDSVSVEAPASSANLGPGFDVFALALDSPRDRVRLRAVGSDSEASLRMGEVTGLRVPKKAVENGACVVCLEMAREHGIRKQIVVDLEKRVPIGLGMGSSGASAAAAAFAMNELFGWGLTTDELIYFAGKGEEVTSGTPHYDNVAASILGGFVVVRVGEKKGDRPNAVRFDPPPGVSVCVATPIVELPRRKTEFARSLLPKTVSLETLVANVASASLMVSGFSKKDINMVGRGMVDRVVEGARKSMIPGYDEVRSGAIRAGAAGVCISGAGPSMLALVDGDGRAADVLKAMIDAFAGEGVKANGHVTKIGEGARVVKGS
jgi:homoserine kinase